ncbi:MarR family winged helix-turn-helix transcriptional regulator [Nocardia tengchongensis]|uniref:MarR family winged helix-turn-helix transcriptional regulator n=1 Tax=Nocardia tengchongensis TaxID=2055889 RepID=UPI0036886FA9
MSASDPLNTEEELVWRALMRVCVALPRELHADMSRTCGLLVNEYVTLMCLSEATDQRLRMTALSMQVGLSPSRMTRVVGNLRSRGLIDTRTCSTDGRGNVAVLTDAGLTKLAEAWPTHLHSVRTRAFDHIDPADLPALARALTAIGSRLQRGV